MNETHSCFGPLFSGTLSLQSNCVVGETSELAWEVHNVGAPPKVTGQWEGLPLLSTYDNAQPRQQESSITPQPTCPSLVLGSVSTQSPSQ